MAKRIYEIVYKQSGSYRLNASTSTAQYQLGSFVVFSILLFTFHTPPSQRSIVCVFFFFWAKVKGHSQPSGDRVKRVC